jgi:hypothetical protein
MMQFFRLWRVVKKENRGSLLSGEKIVQGGPRNCRSLHGSPGFPVGSCGFGQLHVVLFRENYISGAGDTCEVGNPGTLLMTTDRVGFPWGIGFGDPRSQK